MLPDNVLRAGTVTPEILKRRLPEKYTGLWQAGDYTVRVSSIISTCPRTNAHEVDVTIEKGADAAGFCTKKALLRQKYIQDFIIIDQQVLED